MPPRILLTVVTAATMAIAVADAAAAATTVVRVIDGDTVKLRDGGRTRTVDLLGVDAPEPGACHGAEARKALQQLLPARATVRQQADGKRKGRYVYRGRTLVNAALLRAGAARATALDGLAKASQLTTAEQAAKTNTRGLWKACPAPPQPPPTPAPSPPAGTVVTGEEAKQRAIKDLAARAFIHITTTTFSSAESRLHLCSDGSYVEEVSTYSDFGGSTATRYTGRWEVLDAEYRDTTARASVRRLNDDGTIGFVEFVARGGQVTVNGNVVSVQASAVCA
jgi:endonuclease YncB( thermonuclease family)